MNPQIGRALVAPLVAGALALGLFTSSIGAETPTGSVRGRVVAEDTRQPLPDLRVTLRPASPASAEDVYSTRTGPTGEFVFPRVPADLYELDVSSEAFRDYDGWVTVAEGQEAPAAVSLVPGDPFLNLNVHRTAYLPGEDPRVSLHGFRQGAEVRLRLLAIRDTALLRQAGDSLRRLLNPVSGAVRPGLLKDVPASQFRIVREWTHRVRPRGGEGVFYDFLQIGKQPPGAYVIQAAGEASQALGWLLVTDLALVTKSGRGRILAFATHLQTGEPAPGVQITYFQEGRRIPPATTDARGIAETVVDGAPGTAADALARRGESLAFSRFYPNGWGDESRRQHRVHLYTDRPVYRPGHRVRFKGVARRLEPAGYALPSPDRIDVEVRDPLDTVLYEGEVAMNSQGSFAGEFDLPPEVRGGAYAILARFRGERHEGAFQVASYRKPEWEVKVESPRRAYVRGERVPVTLTATYCYGAPVAEGSVTYMVFRSRAWSWWDDEEAELFAEELEESDYGGEVIAEGEGSLAADGTYRFEFPTDTPDPEGQRESGWGWGGEWVYRVEANVTDPSERLATGTLSVRVHPGELKLTVRPERWLAEPGAPAPVNVRVTDLEGRPAAGKQVTLRAVLETWAGNRRDERELVREEATTDERGELTWTVTPRTTGSLFIRVETRDRRGNRVEASADLWVTSAEGGDFAARYPSLAVVPDRKSYKIGETATVLINTDRPGGTALLAVQAEQVLDYRLVPLKGRSTVVRLPVRRGYEPNVYLSACLVRNREFVSSDTSLAVDPEEHRLTVTVTADREVYHPGDQAVFTIRTAGQDGRPVQAEASFGLVDEAVYAIRPEPRAGIWEAFYPRRPNSVDTTFSYPSIYLGDADKAPSSVSVRRNFPDTAAWQPFVRTDARGEARVTVTLPDSLTSWRATVTAHSADTRVGRAIHNIRVMRELTARLQTPRTLTEGDRITVSAVIHNYSPERQNVRASLSASGIRILGDAGRSLALDPGQGMPITWEVEAASPGTATFTLTAAAGPYSDGMELTVPVLPFARRDVAYHTGVVTGEPAVHELDLDPSAASGELEIRLSPTLASSLLGSLEYLATYPYGCTEQTMSSFLPNVVVLKTLRDLDLRQPALEQKLPAMTQAGLLRLYNYQHDDGGWGWWEYDATDPWMTAYVVFGLTLAREGGTPVHPRVLASGVARLLRIAGEESLNGDEAQVVAWVLARAGKKTEAAALLAEKGPTSGSPLMLRSRAYRALAYAAIGGSGNAARARRAMEGLWEAAVQAGGQVHWSETTGSRWLRPSDPEVTALVLNAAVAVQPNDPRLAGVVRWLLLQRQGGRWLSTRDTAFVLLALADYLRASGELKPDYGLTVLLNGAEAAREAVGPGQAFGPERVVRIPFSRLARNNRLEIRKQGAGAAYYTVQLTQEVRLESFAPESRVPGLTVKREYFRLESRRDALGRISVLPATRPTTRFQVGDRMLARITLSTTEELEFLMLEDPLPAGCEVQERGEMSLDEWSYWWSGIDVRDDRVNVFLRDLEPGKNQVIEYYFRPEMAGALRVLPLVLSDMYNPAVRASTADVRVEVRK